jgi:large subunit ribosomal protein L21
VANGKETKFGSPFVEGSKVIGEVVEQGRGDKIKIIKFKRRKHHMKQQGHRQYYTAVKVTEIN